MSHRLPMTDVEEAADERALKPCNTDDDEVWQLRVEHLKTVGLARDENR